MACGSRLAWSSPPTAAPSPLATAPSPSRARTPRPSSSSPRRATWTTRAWTRDPAARNDDTLAALAGRGFDDLEARHLADYQPLFRRVSLDLGTSENDTLPTDERLKRFATSRDPGLVALVFQYGRYLLIASSRAGGQPANLQGVWNDSLKPAVGQQVHGEHQHRDELLAGRGGEPVGVHGAAVRHDRGGRGDRAGEPPRRTTARAAGCCTTTSTSGAAPRRSTSATTASGRPAARGSLQHLWEHYLFTGDREFLDQRAYPLMKDAALFFVDYLAKDPNTGKLISGPSNSPEQGGLVMGPAMDHQIIRALFANTAAGRADPRARRRPRRAARRDARADRAEPDRPARPVAGMDRGQGRSQEHAPPRLAPVGRVPRLRRSRRRTRRCSRPRASRSLFRGDAATGWSMGWKINLWARFLDGDHA